MLMNKGIALQDAIPIAFSSPETLLAHLQDGAQLLDILPQKGMFYQYLRFFSGLCPLPQAIEMADNLCEIRRSLIRQLRSHLTYPAVLFFIAFVLILFFLHFILPQMQQIVDGASAAGALLVLSVLQASFMLILLALLALFILALLLKRNTELRMLVLMRLRRLPLLRSMISYLFAAFLRELSRQGIATVDALGMLLTLEKGSMLYPCVSEMKRLLEEGFSYEEIILTSDYFSPRFCRCFSLGYQSNSLDSLLPLYLQREITLWQKQADRFGALIQLFVYAVIGLLVFSVYQLLLTPLEMLNQM